MARCEFIGAEGEKPKSIIYFGVEFPIGKAVEVTDEFILGKIRGNPEFKIKRGPKPKGSSDGNDSGTD